MSDYIYIKNSIKEHADLEKEMTAVLFVAEKHGIVFGQPIENKQSLVKTAKNVLPDYTLTETVNADCYMIKQDVIDLFGAPSGSLQEYYDKINSYGYSAAVVHKALYSGGAAERDNTHPLVKFLPVLDDEYFDKKRILFECTNLPPTHCGTTEVMLCAFEAFCRMYKDKYDIYMLVGRDAAKYHKLEEKYSNILYPDNIDGVFHLGYVPVQMHCYESQLLINKHCLKIVQQVLDIIMVRSYKQHNLSAAANIDLGVWLSDGITFISNFSRDDYMAYYKDTPAIRDNKKYKVIYVATKMTDTVNKTIKLPYDDFVLIIGNTFKHKVIYETIEAVKNTKHNYIIVGTKKTGFISKNIYGYKSGQLDDEFMSDLYRKCSAVLFPSIYEGYGLPIVLGLENGKIVILYDNALNRELQERFSEYKDNFLFFKKFNEIAETLNNLNYNSQFSILNSQLLYTWDGAAAQLEEFFSEILSIPTYTKRLIERQWLYNHIEDKSAPAQFRDFKMKSLLRFAFKENIKHRHPQLRKILKKMRGDRA